MSDSDHYVPSLETRLRDWLHETPLSLCNMGADTCPDWELAEALGHAIRTNADEDWQTARDIAAAQVEKSSR